MATDTVTSLADDGSAGTLRLVLAGAAPGDTIVFAAGIAGGTVALSGPLPITRSVTINGFSNSGLVTIDGQGDSTDFDVKGGNVTFLDLYITGGEGDGRDGVFGGDADGKGAAGGILMEAGSLTVTDGAIFGNKAHGGHGADGTPAGNGGYAGGGILVLGGIVVLNDVNLHQNNAYGGDAGNGIAAAGGRGGYAGGAIYLRQGSVTLNNSLVSENFAVGGYGGLGSGGKDATANGKAGYGGYGGGAGGRTAGGLFGDGAGFALAGTSFVNNQDVGGNGGNGGIGGLGRTADGYSAGGNGGAGGIGGHSTSGAMPSGAGSIGYGTTGGIGGAGGDTGKPGSTGKPGVLTGGGGGGGGGGDGMSFGDIGGSAQPPPCFAAGTRILTAEGEIPVEHLRIGDRVVSQFGGTVPIAWLGHRQVTCANHPRPQDVWPVRVQAGAFAPGIPARNLLLSPDHAIFDATAGILIPVRYLLNGASIAQLPVASVTYWHVELATHDVLIAEGLPAESYLDTGNRGGFGNGGGAVSMHADFARATWQAEGCADLVLSGPALAQVRQRLLLRAAALGHRAGRDASLQLIAGTRLVEPTQDAGDHRWALPRGTQSVRLRSRSTIPAHIHADDADHRRLGVAVAAIFVDGQNLPLDDPRLGAGWHQPEGDRDAPWRWTNGDAALLLTGASTLRIRVAMTALTWDDERPTDEIRRYA